MAPLAQPSLSQLSANLLLSLYPINQIVKLLHLAPRKHAPTGHNEQTNPSSAIDLMAAASEMAQSANRNAALKQRRSPAGSFSKSDLRNVNQIHAASLNGGLLPAGSQSAAPVAPLELDQSSNMDSGQQNRRPSQSNSVSSFVLPPTLTNPAPVVEILQPSAPQQPAASQLPPLVTPTRRPATNLEPAQQNVASGVTRTQTAQSVTSNRFSFGPPATTTTTGATSLGATQSTASSPNGFADSTPLATTNSISVHNSNNNNQQQQQHTISSLLSSAATTTPSSGGSNPHAHLHPHQQHHTHSHRDHQQPQNVLASFGAPSGRAPPNSFASAKYSLDGIIAVAIFGGFIFLGAIITIIVIIIRR